MVLIAAVIAAPIAYILVVAVKKLALGPWVGTTDPPRVFNDRLVPFVGDAVPSLIERVVPLALLL